MSEQVSSLMRPLVPAYPAAVVDIPQGAFGPARCIAQQPGRSVFGV